MADSKKYIGIYDTLEDVQDALDNGQLSKPYVAKTMDNGHLDYNSLSPVDYSQYWCTYYPVDAKIWVTTSYGWDASTTEYTKGDGKISKADFPDFYCAGSNQSTSGGESTVAKFKYFQFDSTSATTSFEDAWNSCYELTTLPMIDTAKGTNFRYAWRYCSKLKEFPALDLSKGTNFEDAWYGCSSLTTLGGFGAIKASINLSYSPNLTAESLMNVINQAAVVTGKTMKFGSDNLAKLTDEQKSVATSKGWTLA